MHLREGPDAASPPRRPCWHRPRLTAPPPEPPPPPKAGNDFLPNVPSIDIYDNPNGLDILFTAYRWVAASGAGRARGLFSEELSCWGLPRLAQPQHRRRLGPPACTHSRTRPPPLPQPHAARARRPPRRRRRRQHVAPAAPHGAPRARRGARLQAARGAAQGGGGGWQRCLVARPPVCCMACWTQLCLQQDLHRLTHLPPPPPAPRSTASARRRRRPASARRSRPSCTRCLTRRV
jgi:hypothetical protein